MLMTSRDWLLLVKVVVMVMMMVTAQRAIYDGCLVRWMMCIAWAPGSSAARLPPAVAHLLAMMPL